VQVVLNGTKSKDELLAACGLDCVTVPMMMLLKTLMAARLIKLQKAPSHGPRYLCSRCAVHETVQSASVVDLVNLLTVDMFSMTDNTRWPVCVLSA